MSISPKKKLASGSQSRQEARKGINLAIAASMLFGSIPPITKIFLTQVQPWLLAGLFGLSAGIGLGGCYLLNRRLSRNLDNELNGKDWLWLAAATLAGGVTAQVLLMFGIANVPASVVALLLSSEGVFTALIAWLWFRERFDWRFTWGMAAIIAGSVVLTGAHSEFKASWGALAVVGASLGWGISNNLTRQISHKNPLQIAAINSCTAGVVNTAIATTLGQSLPNSSLLLVTSAIGLLNYGGSLICFVLALRYIGASRTGAYFSLSPFAGAVLSAIVLRESITQQLLVAAGLIAVGVWLCMPVSRSGEAGAERE